MKRDSLKPGPAGGCRRGGGAENPNRVLGVQRGGAVCACGCCFLAQNAFGISNACAWLLLDSWHEKFPPNFKSLPALPVTLCAGALLAAAPPTLPIPPTRGLSAPAVRPRRCLAFPLPSHTARDRRGLDPAEQTVTLPALQPATRVTGLNFNSWSVLLFSCFETAADLRARVLGALPPGAAGGSLGQRGQPVGLWVAAVRSRGDPLGREVVVPWVLQEDFDSSCFHALFLPDE